VELRGLEPLTPTLPVRENLAAMPELLGGDVCSRLPSENHWQQ